MGIVASTLKWEKFDMHGQPRSLAAQLIDPVGAFYQKSAFNPYAGPDLTPVTQPPDHLPEDDEQGMSDSPPPASKGTASDDAIPPNDE